MTSWVSIEGNTAHTQGLPKLLCKFSDSQIKSYTPNDTFTPRYFNGFY